MKKIMLWLLRGRMRYEANGEKNGYGFGLATGLSTDMGLDCSMNVRLVDTEYMDDSTYLAYQPRLYVYIQFLPFFFLFHIHTKRF